MVIFIHRPEYYGIEVTDKQGCKESNYGELIVAKHRNGATGLVKFKHNVGMTKFYDYNSQNVNHPHPDSRIENIKPEQDVPF